jgi:hypothetical protein
VKITPQSYGFILAEANLWHRISEFAGFTGLMGIIMLILKIM